MCLGIPGEVVELHPEQPDLAKVDVSGVRRMINIGLLADDPPEPGEWVLIHVGFALSKIDEAGGGRRAAVPRGHRAGLRGRARRARRNRVIE